MAELLLVTGFLGAGKTTLLERLIRLKSDRKLRVIVNEFGREGTDGQLLRALGAAVEEISNGSIFCVCRLHEFEEALRAAAADGAEGILVEASGFSDPVPIRSITGRVPGILYSGCVSVADAANVHKLLSSSRVCVRQLGISGLILLNKTDLVTRERVRETLRALALRFPMASVRPTVRAQIEPAWLAALRPGGGAEELPHQRDVSLQKAFVRVSPELDSRALKGFLSLFAEDTLRVKGVVALRDGLFRADCVGAWVGLEPAPGLSPSPENGLVVLAGEGPSLKEILEDAAALHPGCVPEAG